MTKKDAINAIIRFNNDYLVALNDVHTTDIALAEAKQAFADAKEDILLTVDPKELGSNADVREASINSRLKELITNIRTIEKEHSQNQLKVNSLKSSVAITSRILEALSSPTIE